MVAIQEIPWLGQTPTGFVALVSRVVSDFTVRVGRMRHVSLAALLALRPGDEYTLTSMTRSSMVEAGLAAAGPDRTDPAVAARAAGEGHA